LPPLYYSAFGILRYIFVTSRTRPLRYLRFLEFEFFRIYTKKREVRSFFTLFKGFAIPVLSRKTTEIHARYANPTPPIAGRGMYNIPTGHSLLLFGLSTKCCEDSEESQTTFSINAFYVLAFLRCQGQREVYLLS